ncbi:HAD family phosphatase [Amycolatopsis sp.]|uniref:HAD family hydrolase n=1 Tax=Amycolatopsis sp. TaxID=37632 RepID=UPI002BC523E9|nr:HAD family phosphatase [Amycolatopsis sp.]HVV11904.1 HAD family phosphatase [Amycolatopsis sp.]
MTELAYEAAVFDCDGLLLDTARAWARGFDAAAARAGLRLGVREQAELVGSSVASGAGLIAGWAGAPERREELADAVREELSAAIRACPPPVLPGVPALLRRLRGALPMGVASNAPADVLAVMLAGSGLLENFETVVSADRVVRPKPAPDVYLAACRELDARPENVVALEDSAAGALAAQAAGLAVVVVTASGWPALAPLPWPARNRPVLYVTAMGDPAVGQFVRSDVPPARSRPVPAPPPNGRGR